MTPLNTIVDFLDETLETSKFKDISLNGLQVEGSHLVDTVAVAVDACIESVEKAAQFGANLLITHHGLFWGKPLAITGSHKKIVECLLDSKISLYTSHLPLDAHKDFGNNFCLAKKLGLADLIQCLEYEGQNIACKGVNKQNKTFDELVLKLEELGPSFKPLALNFADSIPKNILVATGSAADALYSAGSLNFDTLITGEPRQFAYHYAKENELNVIFAGHYTTETHGVNEIGKLLAEKFDIKSHFIDIPTSI